MNGVDPPTEVRAMGGSMGRTEFSRAPLYAGRDFAKDALGRYLFLGFTAKY
jgi:hypothetical protein